MTTSIGPAQRLVRSLIARWEAYCARTGMAETTLARMLSSTALLSRLRDPKSSVTVATVDRVAAKLDELEAALPAETKQRDGGDTHDETDKPRQDERRDPSREPFRARAS